MRQTITFLFFTVFTLVLSAQTATIQGGSSYGTIQEAVDASTDGDVILITGVHTESISVSKSITLRGTDPTIDIIQAAASALSDGSGTRVVSLSRPTTEVLNITIENLGIRYGNAPGTDNGGGIDADKITGLLTLKNLIIKDNHTGKNGGGLSLAGTNANIIECTIQNNSSTLDGGGIILAPNNGAGVDSAVNIKQSLIDSNSGRNGGGLYVNGNNGFGNDFTIAVDIENSTVSNNTAFSASGGNGGGAIFCTSFPLTSNTSTGNTTLNLVQATFYNNYHAALAKAGLQFAGTALTNFSAYNSIVVSADDVNTKALNFANTNTTNVVNCILGGLNAAPALLDDVAKNNLKGKTATFAGLTGVLTSEGGSTQVLAIAESSAADDFCSAATGITIPTVDQRGYAREGFNDAGAFEFGGTLGLSDEMYKNNFVRIFPNPAQDFVKISGVNSVNSVRVYSILGTLEKVIDNQIEFNVADLSSGIHMMVIETNGLKTVKRIIKK
ncbi:hypothetical protein GCM10007962_21980 [Yeosuana aromativorans]|uniref:Secretion system C-terminal sorting domain-containing protein n=1 Tax=Yeosuana aromativorans TaxID=288019 RepID=A0A8J3BL75_9FLAO|nr:T9SS type A sorting domain-containing protein [Yeosuana aromativorans]GGK27359.1 hypothetical protein GCM10007962_21980 [Yeosuana aromativorans]